MVAVIKMVSFCEGPKTILGVLVNFPLILAKDLPVKYTDNSFSRFFNVRY